MLRRILFAIAIGLAACGGGVGAHSALVGAQCTRDTQCVHRCLTNDAHYPGGMCTATCAIDADCPFGSRCVTDFGGICAVSCRVDFDCSGFGRPYLCDNTNDEGGGTANVCRAP